MKTLLHANDFMVIHFEFNKYTLVKSFVDSSSLLGVDSGQVIDSTSTSFISKIIVTFDGVTSLISDLMMIA